ncbi:MAG: hypothetical protein OSJ69_19625 [Acetatifactor sp.]|nr:hypothetical protein [Acetatifactor sp.]
MKRKLLAVLLTAAMALSVAGCGNPGSGESSSTPDSVSNSNEDGGGRQRAWF